MIRIASDGFATPLSLRSEHGLLHGQLDVQQGSAGIVVVVRAAEALDARDALLTDRFHRFALSTLSVDLLSHREERYADVHHNVPLLARRLLEFLSLIKERTARGEIDAQPIGLYAASFASPVAIRVAALRDHDIAAVVCRGGLIDLAGALYLRTLTSPLLLLAEDDDVTHTTSNRRALREMHSTRELSEFPAIGSDHASTPGFERAANEAAHWFAKHFANHASAGETDATAATATSATADTTPPT